MTSSEVSMDQHKEEVLGGERFQFCESWSCFLDGLDYERIREGEAVLKQLLGVEDLVLERMKTACGSIVSNEFVFTKT
jgi:hypothetical protein